MIDLKLGLHEMLPSCPTAFTLGKKSYSKLRVPFHPLFSICKRIQLQPAPEPFFQEMLQMLNGDREYFNIIAVEDIVKHAWNFFKVRLDIDPQCLANQIIGLVKSGNDLDILESLSTTTLCSGLIEIQNRMAECTKILAEVENYLNASNRSDTEKRMVKAHFVERQKHKEISEPERHSEPKSEMKPIKPIKVNSYPTVAMPTPPKPQNRKHSNESASSRKKKIKQKQLQPSKQEIQSEEVWQEEPQKPEEQPIKDIPEDNENQGRMQSLSKGQRKRWGDMIHLGIDGDNNQSWRQRYRPAKLPPKKAKEEQPEQAEEFKKAHDLPVVFQYTAKGQGFDFSSLKLPVLLNIQPENIDIEMDKGQITIMKDGKGFKRPTEYIWTKDGFFAEGLTLLLNGMTNIEDGGKIINGAKLTDIVGDCNWLQIKNLTIYKR